MDQREPLISGQGRFRRPFGEEVEQVLVSTKWFDDQLVALAPHDCVLARQLKLARDAYGLIAAISEKFDGAGCFHASFLA